jgi:hypothetical protein
MMSTPDDVSTPPAPRRLRTAAGLLAVIALIALASACKTGPDDAPAGRKSGLLGPDGGVAIGTTGGAPVGSRASGKLDNQERLRLLAAARQAFAAKADTTTAYTIEPTNIDAEPTTVAATPLGGPSTRTDGSTCRLIRLDATKGGQTTTTRVTFCQAPGSNDPKPADD